MSSTWTVGARPEGQALADEKADEIAALSWPELNSYGERAEVATAPTGQVFRVKSRAYWDMEPWESGMNISVRAYAPKGLRRFWGYKAWRTRGDKNDPIPESPQT
jgi:hypothetical protein